MAKAFARAKAMLAAIAAAMVLATEVERQRALDSIGPYRSRGKGRGTPSRRYGNTPGKYLPHQGERERARRRSQFHG